MGTAKTEPEPRIEVRTGLDTGRATMLVFLAVIGIVGLLVARRYGVAHVPRCRLGAGSILETMTSMHARCGLSRVTACVASLRSTDGKPSEMVSSRLPRTRR